MLSVFQSTSAHTIATSFEQDPIRYIGSQLHTHSYPQPIHTLVTTWRYQSIVIRQAWKRLADGFELVQKQYYPVAQVGVQTTHDGASRGRIGHQEEES